MCLSEMQSRALPTEIRRVRRDHFYYKDFRWSTKQNERLVDRKPRAAIFGSAVE